MQSRYKIEFVHTKKGKVWTLRCGKPQKTPLLIIHGGPGFPHNYLESLKELSSDRQVIFYDQLGCGNSERPDNLDYQSVEYFVDELKQVRDTLELEELILFGHSWGSSLACEHASVQPQGVKGIIFASPYLNTQIWMKGVQQNLDQLPQKLQDQIRSNQDNGTTYSSEYAKVIEEYDKNFGLRVRPLPKEVEMSNQGFDTNTYQKLWGPSEFNPSGKLKTYQSPINLLPKVPILFTCGKYDSAKGEFLAEITDKLPGSEIVIFENSSHMPHIEQHDQYIQVLYDFFKKNSL